MVSDEKHEAGLVLLTFMELRIGELKETGGLRDTLIRDPRVHINNTLIHVTPLKQKLT
jgi:hypothetical protein